MRVFEFSASSEEEREEWVNAIEKIVSVSMTHDDKEGRIFCKNRDLRTRQVPPTCQVLSGVTCA